MPVREPKMPQAPNKEREHGKYIYRVEGWPADPETRDAITLWADAWGAYTWQKQIENDPEPSEESAELKKMGETLDSAGNALKIRLPDAKFYDRVVIWDGGHVELSM